jgi:hypothetical protein
MEETSILGAIGALALVIVIVVVILPLSLLKDGVLGAVFFGLFWANNKLVP